MKHAAHCHAGRQEVNSQFKSHWNKHRAITANRSRLLSDIGKVCNVANTDE